MACLRNEIGRETCWMEIVSDGWVFMTPLGKNRALLQAMVPQRFDNPLITFMHLVSQTQAIKHRISTFEDPTTYQEAFPEISNPLCGQGWILAGDSAVSFDPLSGNGTGYALKGAILLVAVISAIVSGFPLSRCLAHYTLRLRTEFLSHLKECLGYYSMWFSTPYWKDEVKLMKKAFSQIVMGNEDFIFGLKNFSLEKLHK